MAKKKVQLSDETKNAVKEGNRIRKELTPKKASSKDTTTEAPTT